MNLLSQFQQLFNATEQAIARVTGVRPDGLLIGTTPTGATVLLVGQVALGKQIFYDRVTGKVLREAPDHVVWAEYGV